MTDRMQKRLVQILLWAGVGVLGIFLIKKTFFLLFPIFFAFLFAEAIHGSLKRLRPVGAGAKRILTVLFLLIFFALLSLIAVLCAERLLHYGTHAAEELSEKIGTITHFCKARIEGVEQGLSELLHTDLTGRFASFFPAMLQKAAGTLAEAIPGLVGGVMAFLPRFFLSLIIFVVSCYYFSCDRGRVLTLLGTIPQEKREALIRIKGVFLRTVAQFFRAYFLLFLLSFSELFLGLVLLGVRGAAGVALMIALIDLLPVLGCGTVLVPWALFSFLAGNSTTGFGLGALYLTILLVRQFAEPKILGSSIGIHPLFSLILVIAGLRLFGLMGMILLPLCGACFAKLREEGA